MKIGIHFLLVLFLYLFLPNKGDSAFYMFGNKTPLPVSSNIKKVHHNDSTASKHIPIEFCDTLSASAKRDQPFMDAPLPNKSPIKDTLTIEQTPSVFVGPSGQIYIIYSRDSLYYFK